MVHKKRTDLELTVKIFYMMNGLQAAGLTAG
jgi:hypothetical protein